MGSNIGSIKRADQIVGQDGSTLGAADLPPKNLKRWVARRKADIVAAVEGGLLTKAEACASYNISREEFAAWLSAYESDGVAGLRARANDRKAKRYRTTQITWPVADGTNDAEFEQIPT
jgi:Protein of unknown function (DUF1153)